MDNHLVATATTSIAADCAAYGTRARHAEAMKHYMFGARVETDWAGRQPDYVVWGIQGATYEDKGKMLGMEPPRMWSYSPFRPLSGTPDKPENYHTVTIRLAEDGEATAVPLSQDGNAGEKSRAEAEKSWKAILADLKKYVESTS
ncbi:MAG: SRPBCC domain-containing protein [Casimicrobiaceae bacterium]